jgi:hypothetical protein
MLLMIQQNYTKFLINKADIFYYYNLFYPIGYLSKQYVK